MGSEICCEVFSASSGAEFDGKSLLDASRQWLCPITSISTSGTCHQVPSCSECSLTTVREFPGCDDSSLKLSLLKELWDSIFYSVQSHSRDLRGYGAVIYVYKMAPSRVASEWKRRCTNRMSRARSIINDILAQIFGLCAAG